MTILGAILCGGESRRFGADKALAVLDGASLIDHVRARLMPQVDATILCGRDEGIADRPHAGLGPLGGLNAALHHALAHGFATVLSVPCDTPAIPPDLVARLSVGAPAFVADLPVIGLWPATLAPLLDAFVRQDARRSMRGFADRAAAQAIALAPIANVNRPEDLDRLRGNYRNDLG